MRRGGEALLDVPPTQLTAPTGNPSLDDTIDRSLASPDLARFME
ncbi:MAG TPA: hypothetical protein VJK66_07825 [Gaiellaceae bacterium]|nr:hypothetical protein [Gaiellaceae bacterium]